MLKLRVTNFQSIKDIELTIQGLTVVTAPSHSGKSALVRAVDALFTANWFQDAYQRHGANHTTVSLVRGSDFLEFSRKGSATTYTINGQSFGKLGGKTPPELSAAGFGEVQIAESASEVISILPQLQNQFDGPYQDIIKPSALTQLLGSFTNLAPYQTAQDRAKKQQAESRRESERLQRDVGKISTIVATLDSFTPESIQGSLEGLFNTLVWSYSSINEIGKVSHGIRVHQALSSIKSIPIPITKPQLTCTETMVAQARVVGSLSKNLSTLSGMCGMLTRSKSGMNLGLPATLFCGSSLIKGITSVVPRGSATIKLAAMLSALKNVSVTLGKPSNFTQVKSLVSNINSSYTYIYTLDLLTKKANALRLTQNSIRPTFHVTVVIKIVNTSTSIETGVQELLLALTTMSTLEHDKLEVGDALASLSARREIVSQAIDQNKCPVCLSPLHETHEPPKKKRKTAPKVEI